MLSVVTLPVVMALSWAPTQMTKTAAPIQAQHEAAQPSEQAATVTCPLTGEQIPTCCCPVKK